MQPITAESKIRTIDAITKQAQEAIYNATGIKGLLVFSSNGGAFTDAARAIRNKVCEVVGVDVGRLSEKTRNNAVVTCRRVSAYVIYQKYGKSMTWAEIAAIVGWSDHSTAIVGVSEARRLIKANNERYAELYHAVTDHTEFSSINEAAMKRAAVNSLPEIALK
jgi:chromosomal replication initiation ATPase DnaA